MVESAWKFTLGSTVILNIGARMLEEVKLPQSNGVDVVMSPDSDWPLLLDGRNSTVKIRFSVLAAHATDKEARWAILTQLAGRAAAPIEPLKIEVAGYTDRYATFAQCKASEFEPALHLHRQTPMQVLTYLLECSGLTLTLP